LPHLPEVIAMDKRRKSPTAATWRSRSLSWNSNSSKVSLSVGSLALRANQRSDSRHKKWNPQPFHFDVTHSR